MFSPILSHFRFSSSFPVVFLRFNPFCLESLYCFRYSINYFIFSIFPTIFKNSTKIIYREIYYKIDLINIKILQKYKRYPRVSRRSKFIPNLAMSLSSISIFSFFSPFLPSSPLYLSILLAFAKRSSLSTNATTKPNKQSRLCTYIRGKLVTLVRFCFEALCVGRHCYRWLSSTLRLTLPVWRNQSAFDTFA